MTEPSDDVVVGAHGLVREIRLNRPHRRNALDEGMFEALEDAVERCAADATVRAVVLSGEPPAFCAGLDRALFQTFADDAASGQRPFWLLGVPSSGLRDPDFAQRVVRQLRRLEVPLIAAVDGPAIGGGLQLALAADIRILSPTAVLSAREIHFGITLDMGGTQLLPRLVGPDRAMEIILTGRDIDAAEAYALGLATILADDARACALDLATSIANRSPDAVRATKSLLRRAAEVPASNGFAVELEIMAANIGSPNQVEAVRAHLDGRAPMFANPAELR